MTEYMNTNRLTKRGHAAGSANSFQSTSSHNYVNLPSEDMSETDPFHTDPTFKKNDLNVMLQYSALVYSYATLRDIIKDNESTLPENKDKRNAVAFEQPELVYTQCKEDTEAVFKDTHMKYPVTAENILKFIKLNRRYLKDVDGIVTFDKEGDADLERGGDKLLSMSQRLMQVDDEFDADLVEFDDEFVEKGLDSELVYAILVNRTEKRITIVFRGSVTLKDWLIDATIGKHNPEEVRAFAGTKTKLHKGFCRYLLGTTFDSKGMTKLEQILSILKQLYAYKDDEHDYSGYGLFITGHSLGGALSQVFAFILAGTLEKEGLPVKTVHAITFASPRCGNPEYSKAFAALEKAGKLRHIRVSNAGDIVAVAPSIGYTQTGINFHVHPNKPMEVGYQINKTFCSQLNCGAVAKHGLLSYHPRLFRNDNAEIIKMSVEELYAKYAGDFSAEDERCCATWSLIMAVALFAAVFICIAVFN